MQKEKESRNSALFSFFAESEGFKPPIPRKGIPDFESSAFGHSANFPMMLWINPFALAKVTQFPDSTKRFVGNLRILIKSQFLQTISELFCFTLANAEFNLTGVIVGL